MHLEILHEGKGSKTGKENLREHTLREGGHATCSKQPRPLGGKTIVRNLLLRIKNKGCKGWAAQRQTAPYRARSPSGQAGQAALQGGALGGSVFPGRSYQIRDPGGLRAA